MRVRTVLQSLAKNGEMNGTRSYSPPEAPRCHDIVLALTPLRRPMNRCAIRSLVADGSSQRLLAHSEMNAASSLLQSTSAQPRALVSHQSLAFVLQGSEFAFGGLARDRARRYDAGFSRRSRAVQLAKPGLALKRARRSAPQILVEPSDTSHSILAVMWVRHRCWALV